MRRATEARAEETLHISVPRLRHRITPALLPLGLRQRPVEKVAEVREGFCPGVRVEGPALNVPNVEGAPRSAFPPRYASVATVWRRNSRPASWSMAVHNSAAMRERTTLEVPGVRAQLRDRECLALVRPLPNKTTTSRARSRSCATPSIGSTNSCAASARSTCTRRRRASSFRCASASAGDAEEALARWTLLAQAPRRSYQADEGGAPLAA